MDKDFYVHPSIQRYVDDHSLRLNKYQLKLHTVSMNSCINFFKLIPKSKILIMLYLKLKNKT